MIRPLGRVGHLSSASVGRRRWTRVRALVVAALAVLGCGDPLAVDQLDFVDPGDLETRDGREALRLGAIGDFATIFGGPFDNFVLATGLLSDELKRTGGSQAHSDVDQRRVTEDNGVADRVFRELHRARRSTEGAAALFLEDAAPEEEPDRVAAELLLLAGYTYVFFGEAFCSGVPVSDVAEDGAITYGPPLTGGELFELAVQRFDEARSHATVAGATSVEAASSVGLARALLGLDRVDEAAVAARSVSTDFRFEMRYSSNTTRQRNAVYFLNAVLENFSAVDREGENGVDYLTSYEQGDPRTPWAEGARDDDSNPHYRQLLYLSDSDPVPLASGVEARLIEAEAALRSGDVTAFDQIHTALRLEAGSGLPPVDTGGLSPDERIDFHFRERALWLWLTGHRLGDLRRLARDYGRDPESVFPTGPYTRPELGAFGTDVNLPVPRNERNNPLFDGCLDRDP
ncbi:MAG: hypothetical protein R3195_00545 [Gemmatimonadota bacterium]|nr:hypothetical protein [Gemmatimonadota bacterium]